jgi:hypothetical protein
MTQTTDGFREFIVSHELETDMTVIAKGLCAGGRPVAGRSVLAPHALIVTATGVHSREFLAGTIIDSIMPIAADQADTAAAFRLLRCNRTGESNENDRERLFRDARPAAGVTRTAGRRAATGRNSGWSQVSFGDALADNSPLWRLVKKHVNNLAFVPSTFNVVKTEDFDNEFMRALYTVGYQMGNKGYPWAKVPPGFIAPEESAVQKVSEEMLPPAEAE